MFAYIGHSRGGIFVRTQMSDRTRSRFTWLKMYNVRAYSRLYAGGYLRPRYRAGILGSVGMLRRVQSHQHRGGYKQCIASEAHKIRSLEWVSDFSQHPTPLVQREEREGGNNNGGTIRGYGGVKLITRTKILLA